MKGDDAGEAAGGKLVMNKWWVVRMSEFTKELTESAYEQYFPGFYVHYVAFLQTVFLFLQTGKLKSLWLTDFTLYTFDFIKWR